VLIFVVVFCDQRKFAQRSERVKSVDLHPTEPWQVLPFSLGAAFSTLRPHLGCRCFICSDAPWLTIGFALVQDPGELVLRKRVYLGLSVAGKGSSCLLSLLVSVVWR
jgi:hypothetical protein